MGTDVSKELVEVADSDGSVLRVVTRSEMRTQNLPHRSVYVAVLAGSVAEPELVVHQRSDSKDINAGIWDLAFGGVCDVGEDRLKAAERELAEEAGIVAQELTFLGQETYYDAHLAVVGSIYAVRYNGPLSFVDREVQQSKRVSVEDLPTWLAGRPVCADSVAMVLPKLPGFVKTIQRYEM